MFMSLFVTFLFIGVLCILFYVPATFAASILQMQSNTLSALDSILTKIPVVNIILAEQTYTGKISLNLIADIIFFAALVLKLVARSAARGSAFSSVATIVLLLAILILWFSNAYIIFIIMHDSEVKTVTQCVLYAMFFTLGQHYIAVYMKAAIRALEKRRETFG